MRKIKGKKVEKEVEKADKKIERQKIQKRRTGG